MKNILKNHWGKLLTAMIVIVLSFYGFIYRESLAQAINLMKDPKAISLYIESYGHFGVLMFILLQVTQVVIFFIPGEVTQAAGGYIFGTFLGTLYSIIGINLGSAVLFFGTRKFGNSLVDKVVPEKLKRPFEKLLNAKKINLIVFLIYLIPGIPKDSSVFLCALSRITFKDFLIYSTLGRMPALVISSFYGANIATGNMHIIIILSVIMVVGLGICMMLKKFFMEKLAKIS